MTARTVEADKMARGDRAKIKISTTDNRNRVDELLGRLKTLLLSCWNKTSFGQVASEGKCVQDEKFQRFSKDQRIIVS